MRPPGPVEPEAPPSGRLFEEDLVDDPFWMMVACSLVNLTTWKAAQPVHGWLRSRYVVARVLAAARPEDLHERMRPLGLWRRRSITLVRLANAWVKSPPRCYSDVIRLPGLGRYAADAWAIFVAGDLHVPVTDRKLAWYQQRILDDERHSAAHEARPRAPTVGRGALPARYHRHRGAVNAHDAA